VDEPSGILAVAALLRHLTDNDDDLRGLATVVAGWRVSAAPAPEARRLRTLGASWDWVALRVGCHRFWDLHVGVLPAPGLPGLFHVGLHWSTAVDQEVRPCAQELLPGGDLVFSATAQEHQLTLSDGGSRSAFTTRPAADAAKQVALVASSASFLCSRAPQRRPSP
jgi:hypothetical protein